MARRLRSLARPWRDNIEALTIALVVAVLFKYFLVEAYKIPTGSMQPTLMGQNDGRGGGVFDRVLVDKLSYRFRDPERFEVAVFQFPLDRSRTFVKRIVGLPGDELRVRGGDLWLYENEGWRIVRKPRGVQRSTWLAVPAAERWSLGLSYDTWSQWGDTLVATGPGEAVFPGDAPGVRDHAAHGYPPAVLEAVGHPRRSGGQHDVGDLRLATRVTPEPECVAVTLEVYEGRERYRAVLAGPAAPAAPPYLERVRDGRRIAADEPIGLVAGRAARLELQNLDDRIELFFGGESVLAMDVAPASGGGSGLRVATTGGGARFDELRVWRDIYYLSDDPRRAHWRIPSDSYVVLGDNTYDSADSREWTRVTLRPADPSQPPASGQRIENENPRLGPEAPESLFGEFVDEWGERHFLDLRGVHTTEVDAPFVRRTAITGRALAVFWPMDPRAGVWRAAWVR